jgi:hypothetical protein
MPYGSTEAIEGSYYDHIHSTSFDGRHQLIESLPAIGGSRDPFIDVLGNLIPSSGTAILT